MKRFSWQIILGSFLILLSIIFYLIHYAVFRDAHHIFIYLLGDVAFVPIEVLLVTLIIHRLLSERDKRTRLKKLNMVIGAFFSEMGIELLKSFSLLDPRCHNLRKALVVTKEWTKEEFLRVSKNLKGYECQDIISRQGAKDAKKTNKFIFFCRLCELCVFARGNSCIIKLRLKGNLWRRWKVSSQKREIF